MKKKTKSNARTHWDWMLVYRYKITET